MRRLAFSIILLVISASLYSSQEIVGKSKIGIFVSHAGDDIVGSRFAYQLKEIISASVRYELVSRSDLNCTLEIALVSLDTNPDRKGNASAIANAYILLPNSINYFGTSGVSLVGSDRVNDMASSAASKIDKVLEDNLDFAFKLRAAAVKGFASK